MKLENQLRFNRNWKLSRKFNWSYFPTVLKLKTKQKILSKLFSHWIHQSKVSNIFSINHLMIRAWTHGGGQPPQWDGWTFTSLSIVDDDVRRQLLTSNKNKNWNRKETCKYFEYLRYSPTLAIFCSWGWKRGPRAWSYTCWWSSKAMKLENQLRFNCLEIEK